ncbi:nucleotide sugar dehydrogenase [Phaeobacter sp. NW0010-22]|uniref:nucleotide sugar dehydrogenase n=1 Tax=Phaeobacter sp. NW0010-22 TaxID=3135907 RepID=UPI00310A4831
MTFEQLHAQLQSKDALIGVIGMGYVGLPLALTFVEAGARVLGFDLDPSKPERLTRGETYLKHIPSRRITDATATGRLAATSDMSRLKDVDIILICVPTPLTKTLEPDLSFVTATATEIARYLCPGQLVVLESTTYPGTTEEEVRPLLETSGLQSGQEFWLAYSPEREDPGNAQFATAQIPKVVGADDDQARTLVAALYGIFSDQVVEVSSSRVAEATKLTENIFRSVNIALANELKTVYGAMDIDVWEVIDAAKTKPFGFMPFYPGPGLGGHCIPIDPFYLTWKARQYGQTTRFIELAGEINTHMPNRVVDALEQQLQQQQARTLSRANILIMGLAYKKNVDDVRESPALRLMALLEQRNASVSYHDPLAAEIPSTREYPELTGRRSVAWNPEQFAIYDAVVIVTDHDGVDYAALTRTAKLIIDTRNVCARTLDADMSRVHKA